MIIKKESARKGLERFKPSPWQLQRLMGKSYSVFRTYLIICLCFVVLYPLIYMVSIALRSTADILDPAVIWIPKHFTWDNLVEVTDIIKFQSSAINTGMIAIIATLLQMITCSLAGYGFARFRFKFKGILFGLLLFSIVVPMQSVTIPLFTQLRFFNLFGIDFIVNLFTGTHVSVYQTSLAIYLPALFANGLRGGMYIYIFRQFFMNMPADLEDAACIDGCGIIKTYTKVIIPLASAPFLVTFILSVIWYWNDVLLTSLFYSKSNTLAMQIDNMAARLSLEMDYYKIFSYQMAGCLLMILPVLVMFLILQKFFVQSIDRTGLK